MTKFFVLLLVAVALLAPAAMAQATPSNDKMTISVDIAAGQYLSGALDTLDRCTITAISIPAGWAGTTTVSFQTADETGAYEDLVEYGSDITVTVAAGKTTKLSPSDWWGIRFLKIRSGTSGTPVTQAAKRTIKFFCN
jgi:hypothetical protein